MRRLPVIILLLCSGMVSAQSDERRVHTVQLDGGQQRAGQPEEQRDGVPEENLALARKLVNLGPDSGTSAETGASCVPDQATMRKDIAAAYRASPAEFHGISPRSVYWREVEQAWRAYYVERCAAQNVEQPAAIIARSYAENLSTDELREVLAFQESRSGRAFIAASGRAQQDLQQALAARTSGEPEAAMATFRQALLRLKAKYDRAPK